MTLVDFSYWAVIVFFAGSVIKYLFSDLLGFLQYLYEKKFSNKAGYDIARGIHPIVETFFPFDKYMLAAEYSGTSYRFGEISKLFGRAASITAIVFCVYPEIMLLTSSIPVLANNCVLTIILTAVAIDSVMALIHAPFDLYSTFVIERKYGFNSQTLGCWLSDFGKNWLICSVYSSFIIAIAYYGICAFTSFTGFDIRSVPFIALVVIAQVMFGLFWESFYIRVIAPMFNKFTPMEDGELKNKILNLISGAGYSVSGIYIMDAGKRSRHSNAYFTGWGRNKRIVLYDTLLNAHTDDEIMAILGHEAGHLVHGDILRGRIIDTVYSALKMVAIVFLITDVSFYNAFGFGFVTPENIMQWYVVGWWFAEMVFASVEWVLTPFWSALSRHDEYAADRWSAEHVGAGAMIKSLIRLYAENLSGLHDHPLYEFWYYSHPGIRNRIGALRGIIDT